MKGQRKVNPRKGGKWPEKSGSEKGIGIERKTRGTNPKKWKWQRKHQNKEMFGSKCSKREELRESNDETGVKRKKTEKGGGENALEREGMKFRLEGSKKIGFETLF